MLTCQEVTNLVNDYVDGTLSFGDRLRFRMHVGMCRNCRSYLHDRQLTIKALGKLQAEPIPAEVRDGLMARFRDWKRD